MPTTLPDSSTMISIEFITTALIVVLIPGTGVIYTISSGIFGGSRASVAAAIGCTLGIVPHLAVSIFGLSLILHMSAVAFQGVRILGGLYLLYLAWGMWRNSGSLSFEAAPERTNLLGIARKAVLINILNPKLSLFFLAFLPSFIQSDSRHPTLEISLLSAVFMTLTLLVFLGYGFCASQVRSWFTRSARFTRALRRSFSACFAFLGIKLIASEA